MTTPVTCTFPDSDTHTVEYPSDAQLTVLAIRNKLVSLTPYDAEAIQLFSTEGEGRELTNDQEVIPPGSELQATIHDDQAERKTALCDALANKDHANCWARVIICKDKTPLLRDYLSIGGAMMRLTAVNGEFFSFIGFEKLRDKRHRFGIPDYFLLHKSELEITDKKAYSGKSLEPAWFKCTLARSRTSLRVITRRCTRRTRRTRREEERLLILKPMSIVLIVLPLSLPLSILLLSVSTSAKGATLNRKHTA